jgi:Zn-dependent metalloprotease
MSLSLVVLLALLAGCHSDTLLTPLGNPLFSTGSEFQLAEAEALAADSLLDLAARHGMDGVDDFVLERAWVDDLATAHVRVAQSIHGVPVFGAEAIVHLDPWGRVTSVTDDLLDDVAVDTTATVGPGDALALAVDGAGGWGAQSGAPHTQTVVLRANDGDHLVYAVHLTELAADAGPAMPIVFLDAHTGAEVWRYDDLQTATGSSAWYGTVPLGTTAADGTWYLEDTPRHIGTFTFDHTTDELSALTDDDDRWTSRSTEEDGVDAHYAAAAAYDFYAGTFGRDGIDGAGGPGYLDSVTGAGSVLSVLVQYDTDYLNAAWTGGYILIGSGDGYTAGALTTLDIVGHELTHGVTAYSADLAYAGESGALNESMSDCMGAMIERSVLGESADTWTMGEANWTPGTAGDALRYMADPTRDGSGRDYYADRYTGSGDNGGVHDNAGIGNLAFYLLAEGGAHPRRGGAAMTGIGADAAAAVWYRALTTYMTSSTSFAGARTATVTAATDLYGADATEAAAVGQAWALVGVGESTADPAPPGSASGSTGGETGGSTGGEAGATGGDCPTGFVGYTGTLADSGSSAYVPDSAGYTTTAAGTHTVTLESPGGADFDVALYRQSATSTRWYRVAIADRTDTTDTLSYTGPAAAYRLRVISYSGGGDYTVCVAHP